MECEESKLLIIVFNLSSTLLNPQNNRPKYYNSKLELSLGNVTVTGPGDNLLTYSQNISRISESIDRGYDKKWVNFYLFVAHYPQHQIPKV